LLLARPNELTAVTNRERFDDVPGDVTSDVDQQRWLDFREAYHRAQACSAVGPFPLQLDFELNAACNFKCAFCTHGSGPKVPEHLLPFALYARAIDEAAEHGLCSTKLNYINEPLLHPNLPAVVRYAKAKGVLNVYFATNGLLLREPYALKLIDAGLSKVMVSLDADTPETFRLMRQSTRFDEVVANIHTLLALRHRLGVTWPLVRVNFLKTATNMHEAEAFLKRWTGVADMVGFQDRVGLPGTENDFTLTDPALVRNLDSFKCAFPFKSLIIEHTGGVLPCCTFSGRLLRLGYLQTMTLQQAWTSPEMLALQALHRRGGFRDHPVCAHCVGGAR
jgi:MoaA/NifB/PqqE/SkfB family radical SAM enzyme